MTTVTIPTTTQKSEKLIAISQDIYKEFLAWQKKEKSKKEFTPTSGDKKDLKKAQKNLKEGKCLTIDELRTKLEIEN